MTIKEIRKSRWFKFFSNIYVLVLTLFVIWMLFFDTNSWWFTHRELNNEIKKLQQQKIHLQKEIANDKRILKNLKSKEDLEKYAREIGRASCRERVSIEVVRVLRKYKREYLT